MKRPFDTLSAHGCAIYKGEQQVATTDPGRMSGADGDEMPSMEDIARAKMFAACPQAFEALFWILRCAKLPGPRGVTSYAIRDEIMDKAMGAMLLAGIDWEKLPIMTCSRCNGECEVLISEGVRVLCVNCNGRGER